MSELKNEAAGNTEGISGSVSRCVCEWEKSQRMNG